MTSCNVSFCIQHHPKRADLLPGLILASAELVSDPDPDGFPSPWRTYRAALERTPEWATHRLVLQDDVKLCDSFAKVARRAVEARPDVLVSLFCAGEPRESADRVCRAWYDGDRWASLDTHRWCPAVALCWPKRLIPLLLAWYDEQGFPPGFRADDEIIGRFLRENDEEVWCTVPSLLEHPDDVPSLVGRRALGGADCGRLAAIYVGDTDLDPLTLRWD